MKKNYYYKTFPPSRIATFDIFSVSYLKHHVSALLEFDITESREKLKKLKSGGQKISFNAWILKEIATTLTKHPEVAAFLYNKRKLIIFNDINISVVVEKEVQGNKVPIPLVIAKAHEKGISEITSEIEQAKRKAIGEKDIVLHQKTKFGERLYYRLPGFLRRSVWKFMLRNPKIAYGKMGNVVVTSMSTIGKLNNWFIHKSVHPVSFGIGAVTKKPVVVNDEIVIREILSMTVLIDHDVVDGVPMAKFVQELIRNIESGSEL